MTAATQAAPVVPPLVEGERLTREEFERRYSAMPEVKKAELIDGVVHMPSPVSFEQHGEPHAHLVGLLGLYTAFTPGVRGASGTSVRLDAHNEFQPDALLLIDPRRRGRTTFTDGFVTGGPEMACEVAASSLPLDRGPKRRAYRCNGVREYLLWRVEDRAIDWFSLRAGEYEPLAAGPDGIVRSTVFPGLWLDATALVAGDMPRVLAVVQAGVASPEHAAFVAGIPPAT